jgi:hypothetical protein
MANAAALTVAGRQLQVNAMLSDIYQTKAYDSGCQFYNGAIQALRELVKKMDEDVPTEVVTPSNNKEAESIFQLLTSKHSPAMKAYEEEVAYIQLKMIADTEKIIECIKIGRQDHQKSVADMTLVKHKLMKQLKKEIQLAEKEKVVKNKKKDGSVGGDDNKQAMIMNQDNNDTKQTAAKKRKSTTAKKTVSKKKVKKDVVVEERPQIMPLVIPETEDVLEQKPIQPDVSPTTSGGADDDDDDDADWEMTD